MKKISLTAFTFSFFFFLSAQVKIGQTAGTAHPASLLELSSTDKGLLLPRLTTVQIQNVQADAQSKGLLLFNTDSNKIFVYSGTAWKPLGYSDEIKSWQLTGNSNTDAAKNFIGNIDSIDLSFRTNNTERFIIKANGFTGIGTQSPIAALEILNNSSDNGGDDFRLRSFNETGGGPALLLHKGRGSSANPVNLHQGDFLGILVFGGQVNNSETGLSNILSNYLGDGNTKSSNLVLKTSLNEGLYIDEKGWTSIGSANISPKATADIKGSVRFKINYPTGSSIYYIKDDDLMLNISSTSAIPIIGLTNGPDFDGHLIIIKNNKASTIDVISAGNISCQPSVVCGKLPAGKSAGFIGAWDGFSVQWIQLF